MSKQDQLVQAITKEVQKRLQGMTPEGAPKRSWHQEDAALRSRRQRPTPKVSPAASSGSDGKQYAKLIDHTLLKPEASEEQLAKVCQEARDHGFYSVCVNSCNVRFVAKQLEGCDTLPIAVVGFPLGAQRPDAKAYEARQAIRDGAQEIDMVVNLGALKSKNYTLVLEDIQAVVDASAPLPVKVILETAQLNEEEKVIVCALTSAAKAAFVKTSTGFSTGGATVDDVSLMRRIVGMEMGVKASGGVRNAADAAAMVAAGATRLGCSSSVAVVTGGTATGSY
jgi:deoxyribose-phosphate aldolase